MNTLQICPPYLSDVATFQKSHFSTLLFIYFTLFMLPQKKTNSNCCTEALRVYLLLFSASYIAIVLRLGHTIRGARVLIWTCWGLWQRLVAIWAEFQHSVVHYAIDQCWKRLEACINAEDGHSEHLLRHCLPDISVATHHNRFFSTYNWLFSGPPTFEITQQTFSQTKKVSQFTSQCGDSFRWGGQVDYHLFPSKIT